LRDAAGKPAPQRYADPRPHLLLQAYGRADEKDAIVLEQERGRVGPERLAYPAHQRAEELVERMVQERGLRDRLHPGEVRQRRLRLAARPLRDDEQLLALHLRLPPPGDVAEDEHAADELARIAPDRGRTVVDRHLRAVLPDEDRVIGQADDD